MTTPNNKPPPPPSSLSPEERLSMKRDFVAFMDANPLPAPAPRARIVSPYFPTMFRVPALVAMMLLVVTGTSFAAEESLPNDFLYPLKTEFLEPVFINATALTPLARAEANQELMRRRLDEAGELIKAGKLDAQAASTLSLALEDHADIVEEYVTTTKESGEVSEALEVGSDLETLLTAYGEVLESIANDDETPSDAVEDLLDDVSNQTDDAEDASSALEELVARDQTGEYDRYIVETITSAEVAVGTLEKELAGLSDSEEELVTEAAAQLALAQAALEGTRTLLSESAVENRDAILSLSRETLQQAQQGLILLDNLDTESL